jgi:hypothetical protein
MPVRACKFGLAKTLFVKAKNKIDININLFINIDI